MAGWSEAGGLFPEEPEEPESVEPGLYAAAADEEAPEAFRGTGIRIEDDVLVTDTGREVLSAAVPKTIADIETHMRQAADA